MTRKYDDWQQRWSVDLEACRASHESGLVTRFVQIPQVKTQKGMRGGETTLGKCWTLDGREWSIVTSSEMLAATLDALEVAHGARVATAMMTHLVREAAEIWAWRHTQRR